MINNYDILQEKETGKLLEKVRWFIDKGWQPLGGITVHNGLMLQVIIKHKEIKNE